MHFTRAKAGLRAGVSSPALASVLPPMRTPADIDEIWDDFILKSYGLKEPA